MLQQIELQFFKCFALLKLPVGPLTLLSGANASGKSSVMQALVLLHQTIRDHEWSIRLMLNGTSIRLGTASAVVDDVFGRRTCAIALLDGDTAYEWDFAGDRDEMSMGVERVRANGSSEEHPDGRRTCAIALLDGDTAYEWDFAGGSRRTPDPSPPGRSAHGAVLSRLRPHRGEDSACQCRGVGTSHLERH